MPKGPTDKKKRPKPTHWRTDLRMAEKAVSLAQTYIEDGALITGADRLREAADLFQSAGEKRNAMLDRLVQS